MKSLAIPTPQGNRVAYVGDKRGYPQLICVHGGMGLGADSLTEGHSSLSRTFDLVFYDQRGCGKSDPATNESYTLEEFASDLKLVVDAIGADRPRGVLGHSLGGMVALKALADYPDLFDFAIIVNSAMNDGWRSAAAEAVQKRTDTAAVDAANAKFNQDPLSDDLLRAVAVEYGPIYFPELAPESAKTEMRKFSYRAAAIPFTNAKVYPGLNLSKEVSAISKPVLVISGEMDVVVPVTCQQALADALPHSTLSLVPNAGHFPFVTQTEIFEGLISQWWEKVRTEVL
jgi:aminoacrylate hydrolase